MFLKFGECFIAIPSVFKKKGRTPPNNFTYGEIINHLIIEQEDKITYNKAVIAVGLLGLLIGLIGFLMLWIFFWHYELSALFTHKEVFPVAIWSLVVSSFNTVELESRRKILYEMIREKGLIESTGIADEMVKQIQSLTWEGFKDNYK